MSDAEAAQQSRGGLGILAVERGDELEEERHVGGIRGRVGHEVAHVDPMRLTDELEELGDGRQRPIGRRPTRYR